jgi:hypothetical protein
VGIFSNRRNRKERERIVDLARALEAVGPPEGEPGVVTFAELDYLIDLPTEEELAAERADRRRDSIAQRSIP